MDIVEMRSNVAQNIYYLRTANNMTQSELGEKLNYSDKAISKWERAEGMPDAFVLHSIGKLFGVSVDYLLHAHSEQDKKVETKPVRSLKKQIAGTVLWGIIAVAVLLIVVFYLSSGNIYWQIAVFSLPITFIVQIVLSAVWWRGKGSFIYTSMLLWSVIATIYVALINNNYWQLFFIGVPAQIIVFFCYRMKISITITKKSDSLFDTSLSEKEETDEKTENGEKESEKDNA